MDAANNGLTIFCTHDCGRVKSDVVHLREELRFLTHQVARLVQASVGRASGCSTRPNTGARLPTIGPMEQAAQRKCWDDLTATGLRNPSNTMSLTPSYSAVRHQMPAAVSFDQLLPKFTKDTRWNATGERGHPSSASTGEMHKLRATCENADYSIGSTEQSMLGQRAAGNVNQQRFVPKGDATAFSCSSEEGSSHSADDFGNPLQLPTARVCGPALPLVTYVPKSSSFFCSVCQRRFSAVYYKRHMIVHSNARPYVCDVCGKRFNERSNMIKHRQRLHAA